MKNSKTPKIVVAAGLVAVYASGMAYMALSDKPAAAVVQNSPVAAQDAQSTDEQLAAEQMPADVAVATTEVPTGLAEQPVAASSKVEPAASVVATTQRNEQVARMPVTTSEQQSEREVAKPVDTAEAIVASNETASVAGEAQPAQPAETAAAAGNDSQITDDVKTQIAAVAPAAAIDVTTKDGVVELAGSVPSQEQIDKVWLAARNVPAVRGVDISGLMVSN